MDIESLLKKDFHGKFKAEFFVSLKDIERALASNFAMVTIWRSLREENLFSGSYDSFVRCVKIYTSHKPKQRNQPNFSKDKQSMAAPSDAAKKINSILPKMATWNPNPLTAEEILTGKTNRTYE